MESAEPDRAFNDRNRNGIQDAGEVGMFGVILILRTSSGAVVGVQSTGAAGTYWFSNVPGGTYYIEVIGPVGFGLTVMDAGGNDNLDSDFDGESASSPVFTFPTNGNRSNIDAGFQSVIQS